MLSLPYHMSDRTAVAEGGLERAPSRQIRQGVSVSCSNAPQDVRYVRSGRPPRPVGRVDFTFMYAAHDAFTRDLRRLADAVEGGRTAEAAVRAGWATFKNQLHFHHTAEDNWLWPALREKVTRPDEISVLDAMEAEHLLIDPLLFLGDARTTGDDLYGLPDRVGAFAPTLPPHI